MLVTSLGIAGMTTLHAHTPYSWSALWLGLVGIGSGIFNSPNTSAMMGAVPVHRRGIASGMRMMLTNTGAVISIAFVMAVVTAAVPARPLIFSGLASDSRREQLDPFIWNMHMALWYSQPRRCSRSCRPPPGARAARSARGRARGGRMIRIGSRRAHWRHCARSRHEEIGPFAGAERRKGEPPAR
jgi:hypothetical protein